MNDFAAGLANHLWQTTLFVVAAGLLTLLLRENCARVRHWIWLVVSIKFLIPFSLLLGVGTYLGKMTRHEVLPPSRWSRVVQEVGKPFTLSAFQAVAPEDSPIARTSGRNLVSEVFPIIWLCGFVSVVWVWARDWRRARVVLSGARPFSDGREVEAIQRCESAGESEKPVVVLSSSSAREPGVLGFIHPVLLLPAGISNHLTDSELDAVVAHEMAHVRRRDNLTSAIHTGVQSIFWFHPLVWLVGTRLMDEREQACDEEVLEAGKEPRIYAQGILKVCQFYMKTPSASMAGMTGSNLKKRIEGIMNYRGLTKLSVWKRMLLVAASVAAVAGPLVVGLVNAPRGQAQSIVATVSPVPEQQKPFDDVVYLSNAEAAAGIMKSAFRIPQSPPSERQQELRKWQDPDVAFIISEQEVAAFRLFADGWLSEVAYIVSEQESAAFKLLKTDEEREAFRDQFWLRRDPSPATSENEYRNEYYRRVAYSNEHFGVPGVAPGWQTDRGRIYITYGPPSEIDSSHLLGGPIRPSEGGGVVAVFPHEMWWYRSGTGVGNDIELEFVDTEGKGDFRLTLDPSGKPR